MRRRRKQDPIDLGGQKAIEGSVSAGSEGRVASTQRADESASASAVDNERISASNMAEDVVPAYSSLASIKVEGLAGRDEALDLWIRLLRAREEIVNLQDQLELYRDRTSRAEARERTLEQDLVQARDEMEKCNSSDMQSLRQRVGDLQRALVDRARDIAIEQSALSNERRRVESHERSNTQLRLEVIELRFKLHAADLELKRWRNSFVGKLASDVRTGNVAVRKLAWKILRRPTDHPLFDSAFYLDKYPDVVASGDDPFMHFMRYGVAERRNPNIMFDVGWYIDQYPDVASSGTNPIFHYHKFGYAELRDPHPLFSTKRYLDQHPTVKSTGEDPLLHFLKNSRSRSRLN